jgi:hypothetical protein
VARASNPPADLHQPFEGLNHGMRRSLWVRWVMRMRRKLQLCDDDHAGTPRGRSGPRRRSPDGRHGVWSEAPCARVGGTALDSLRRTCPWLLLRGSRVPRIRSTCRMRWWMGIRGIGAEEAARVAVVELSRRPLTICRRTPGLPTSTNPLQVSCGHGELIFVHAQTETHIEAEICQTDLLTARLTSQVLSVARKQEQG